MIDFGQYLWAISVTGNPLRPIIPFHTLLGVEFANDDTGK